MPDKSDSKGKEKKEEEKIKLKSGFGEENKDSKSVDISHEVWNIIESDPIHFVSEKKRKYKPFSTLLVQNSVRKLVTDAKTRQPLERLMIGHYQIDGQPLEFQTLSCIAESLPPLKQLTFRNCQIDGPDLDYMLQKLDCNKLEVFELDSVEILKSQIHEKVFQIFLQSCKSLKQLTLNISGMGITPIIEIQLPNSMEKIQIKNVAKIDWNVFSACKKLKCVQIFNEKPAEIIGNMEDGLLKVAAKMEQFELHVGNQPITEEILVTICSQYPNLKIFKGLFDPQIGNWSAIGKLNELQELQIKLNTNNLSKTRYPTVFSEHMLQEMFDKSQPSLKKLELFFDDLEENVLKYLAINFKSSLECLQIEIQSRKSQFQAVFLDSFIIECSKLKQLEILNAQKCDLPCLVDGEFLETVTIGSNFKDQPVQYSKDEFMQMVQDRRDFIVRCENTKGKAKDEIKKINELLITLKNCTISTKHALDTASGTYGWRVNMRMAKLKLEFQD